jgi:phage gp46-like protein
MDFGIVMDTNGRPSMTFDKAVDGNLFNNAYLSLAVKRGSFFQNPEFGRRLHTIRKNTPDAPAKAETYAMEALQWLIDCGRVTKVEVKAQRDGRDVSRLNLLVELTAASGNIVTFSDFVGVI